MYTYLLVHLTGLEPARLSAPDSHSGLATNYNTDANFTIRICEQLHACSGRARLGHSILVAALMG